MLIETLHGHGTGRNGSSCVNAVAWNPVDAAMFASAGDDRKVRMYVSFFVLDTSSTLTKDRRWSSEVPPGDAIPTAGERRSGSIKGHPRTSAIRSTSNFHTGSNL